METKYVRIPFDVELAKKITSGEVEGRIVTRDDKSVRIVCFDAKQDDSIVALISYDNIEQVKSYAKDGLVFQEGTSPIDLMLEVPEEKPKCEFKPFDKVLVRDLFFKVWYNDIFSFVDKNGRYMCIGNVWDECIPYNEQTAHLLGTTENYK